MKTLQNECVFDCIGYKVAHDMERWSHMVCKNVEGGGHGIFEVYAWSNWGKPQEPVKWSGNSCVKLSISHIELHQNLIPINYCL